MTGPETPVAEESVEQPAIAADASVSRAPWRRSGSLPSLPEAYRSIPIQTGAPVWRKLLAFAGPGYLVAVGYMDPGNWATDLGGGSKFGYTLLSVILISNLMAMFLQALSAKLGIARSEEHTSELQSPCNLVCRLLLEKKKQKLTPYFILS